MRQNYLSKDNSLAVRGIMAIAIWVIHLQAMVPSMKASLIGRVFPHLAYIMVAIFFFFSGYGCMVSFLRKGDHYIETFWHDRVLNLYLKYIIAGAITLTASFIFWDPFSFRNIMNMLLLIDPNMLGGWYIQALLIMYGLWYIGVKYFYHHTCGYSIVAILLYLIIVSMPIFWFELFIQSAVGFPLGCFWAAHKNEIDKFCLVKKNYIWLLILSGLLFVATWGLGNIHFLSSSLEIFIKIFSSLFGVLFTLLLLMIFNFSNGFTNFLGRISFNIYIMQGLFFYLFHCKLINVDNPFLYSFLTLLSTLIFSYLLSSIYQRLDKCLIRKG